MLSLVCPVTATRRWIRDVVINHRFCPWAAGAIPHLWVTSAADDCAAYALALETVERVASTPKATAMIVIDSDLSFRSFLDLCDRVDAVIDTRGFRGDVQLANFHPEYEFADTEAAAHWTNRSPLPVLHFLREDDVEEALASFDRDPDDIWRANVETCRRLGEPRLRNLLEACSSSCDNGPDIR